MATTGGAAFRPLLDRLGTSILDGSWPAGSVGTVDGIVGATGASRTVVREATRVLVALGMLRAGRRVGLTVLGRSEWNLLDPQIIEWRLAGPERAEQVAELRGLRLAVEPEAARAAAVNRTNRQLEVLRASTELLRAAAERRDREGFLVADRRFHRVLLEASGNPLLVRLSGIVAQALDERAPEGDAHWRRAPKDVAAHTAAADALAARDADAAGERLREIIVDHA